MRDPLDRETTPPETGAGAEPEEIREDIETTRADMGETIDAIQERLSPGHMMDQAKASVREATIGKAEQVAGTMGDTAREKGGGIVETIKQHPVPAALAAVGLGWLWRSRERAAATGARAESYPTGYVEPRTGGGAMGQAQERAGEAASQVQGEARQAADQAQQRVGEWTGQAQEQMQSARGQFDRLLQENPLAVALAAFGLGAAVGLAVPETPQERQVMGQARDTMVDKAQSAAQQTMEKAQHVAERAQQAASEEAQQQGMTE